MMQATRLIPSPIGVLEAGAGNGRIRSLRVLPDSQVRRSAQGGRPEEQEDANLLGLLEVQLKGYFAGHRKRFDLPVEVDGASPWFRRVYGCLRRVRYGRVISYGALAAAAGRPGAARAAGQAMRSNPLLILVPCHRVVRADGGLGGFSSGLWRKTLLLELEGVSVDRAGADGRYVVNLEEA